MKRFVAISMVCSGLAAFAGAARAEYRPPPKQSDSGGSSDRFGEAVDLSRVRKGNLEWDTQQLIASGLTALHEEHLRILEKLDQMQARLERMERDSGTSKRE